MLLQGLDVYEVHVFLFFWGKVDWAMGSVKPWFSGTSQTRFKTGGTWAVKLELTQSDLLEDMGHSFPPTLPPINCSIV